MSDCQSVELNCSTIAGFHCSTEPCPGRTRQAICLHLAELSAWRRLPLEEQGIRLGIPRPTIDSSIRDAVNACPFRGPVLPLSLQEGCDCRGKELSECRDGRGLIPGRVTLRDCLKCQGALD